jgi:peptide methionine sulfoxide reductase msrA/msrB
MKSLMHLLIVAGAALTAAGILTACNDRDDEPASQPDSFQGSVFDESGTLVGPLDLATISKSDEEWRQQLTPSQYKIVREAGTERAFTGELLKNPNEGVYQCVACDLPLFGSDAKFKSGTGWPSFYQPIAKGNIGEHVDDSMGMRRTEITCARCGGHLGHVFNDGPQPTGLRYCLNSQALGFTPMDQVMTLAEPDMITTTEKIVFAGGCFWCVEAVFEELDGVKQAVSGYAGGTKETANYKDVCSGTTRHAEAVEIEYDPSKISYEDLLRVHFATHDPTQLNRQGNDMGPQYRSTIFYANDEQKALAQAFLDDLASQQVFKKPIVTTLEPLTEFYPAESYHQNYVCENPNQGYVRSIALPKVEKVRKAFKDRLKEQSPLDAK